MLAGNISSKSNLTQQDPSDLCTSQGLKTYYFRDETMRMDWTAQAFGKLELLHKCFLTSSNFPPSRALPGICPTVEQGAVSSFVKANSAPY